MSSPQKPGCAAEAASPKRRTKRVSQGQASDASPRYSCRSLESSPRASCKSLESSPKSVKSGFYGDNEEVVPFPGPLDFSIFDGAAAPVFAASSPQKCKAAQPVKSATTPPMTTRSTMYEETILSDVGSSFIDGSVLQDCARSAAGSVGGSPVPAALDKAKVLQSVVESTPQDSQIRGALHCVLRQEMDTAWEAMSAKLKLSGGSRAGATGARSSKHFSGRRPWA